VRVVTVRDDQNRASLRISEAESVSLGAICYGNLAAVLTVGSGRDRSSGTSITFHTCGLHLWCFRFAGLTRCHGSPRLVRRWKYSKPRFWKGWRRRFKSVPGHHIL